MDLPTIDENMTIHKSNCFAFSIVIEDNHYLMLPKTKYNQSELFTPNSSNNITNGHSSFDIKTNTNPLLDPVGKKKSICFCFRNLFSKKKKK